MNKSSPDACPDLGELIPNKNPPEPILNPSTDKHHRLNRLQYNQQPLKGEFFLLLPKNQSGNKRPLN